MTKRKWIMVGVVLFAVLIGSVTRSLQGRAIRTIEEATLRQYAGVYQWETNSFLYLQLWHEFTGTNQLMRAYRAVKHVRPGDE